MVNQLYTEYNFEKTSENINKKRTSREELQQMIGLEKVKTIVEEILAVYKVNKMRSTYGNKDYSSSRHMMFVGNPGTAKTTVARLIAGILKEEGILESGKFVECTHADLVGQYVGWTSVQVKKKFRKARGGILFIDEAYSLVDDINTFGDEAINTIVAEMENMREEVIVIFAGYHDKMQTFLDKNEGLKSRITYHIQFPDYKPNELLDILKKLVADRDFILESSAKEKVFEIFQKVYKEPDYGNGHFVRNLLEKAIFRQATRISFMPIEKPSKLQLFQLVGDDFADNNYLQQKSDEKIKIGFRV